MGGGGEGGEGIDYEAGKEYCTDISFYSYNTKGLTVYSLLTYEFSWGYQSPSP